MPFGGFNPTRRYTHFRGTFSTAATSFTVRRRLIPSSPTLNFPRSNRPRESRDVAGDDGGSPESCRPSFRLVDFSLSVTESTVGLSLYRVICHPPSWVHHTSGRFYEPFAA